MPVSAAFELARCNWLQLTPPLHQKRIAASRGWSRLWAINPRRRPTCLKHVRSSIPQFIYINSRLSGSMRTSRSLRPLSQISKGFSVASAQPHIARMSTIASFKIPKVTNEPNVCGTFSWMRLNAKLTRNSITMPKDLHSVNNSPQLWRASRKRLLYRFQL
jgi:hypothetical protein